MPGIAGYGNPLDGVGDDDLLRRMLDSMRHESWYQVESAVSGGVGLGRVSLGFVNTTAQPVTLAEQQLSAVMDGELYRADQVREQLRRQGRTFAPRSEVVGVSLLLLPDAPTTYPRTRDHQSSASGTARPRLFPAEADTFAGEIAPLPPLPAGG